MSLLAALKTMVETKIVAGKHLVLDQFTDRLHVSWIPFTISNKNNRALRPISLVLFSMALKYILISIIDRFAINTSPHAALLFKKQSMI